MTDLDDGDLRALLDSSFGEGPTLPPLVDTLGAGRRAVRRRRVAAVGTALAAVLVIGGGALALTGDDVRRAGDGVPPATQAPEPSLTVRTAGRLPGLARISGERSVEVAKGVEVSGWRDDPLDVPAPGWSVGLELRTGGETIWLLLSNDATSGDSVLRGGPAEARSFDAWVTAAAATQAQPGAADPTRTEDLRELVAFGPAGDLVVLDGVTLLDRVDGPGPRTVAVEVEYDGRVRWIAIETEPGDNGDSWSVEGRFADDHPGQTFADFVARTTGGGR